MDTLVDTRGEKGHQTEEGDSDSSAALCGHGRLWSGRRVVVHLFKKWDQRVCSNYQGTHSQPPGKVYSRVLERRVQLLVEPQIQEE